MKKGLTKVFYYTRKGQRAHAYLIKNKQFEQGSLRLLKQMESMCIHVESKLKKGVGGSKSTIKYQPQCSMPMCIFAKKKRGRV